MYYRRNSPSNAFDSSPCGLSGPLCAPVRARLALWSRILGDSIRQSSCHRCHFLAAGFGSFTGIVQTVHFFRLEFCFLHSFRRCFGARALDSIPAWLLLLGAWFHLTEPKVGPLGSFHLYDDLEFNARQGQVLTSLIEVDFLRFCLLVRVYFWRGLENCKEWNLTDLIL